MGAYGFPHWDWSGPAEFINDSAQQIAVARNADGRLEMFYVGTNGDLYHNWQTTPGGAWAGETQFTGDSARQIAVAQNQDGLLEIFYVGSDYMLYHNRQLTPAIPGGKWAGETAFSGHGATQVAVAQNADGRLEIFYIGYIGNNLDLYHNWQTAVNSTDWAGEAWFPGDSGLQVSAGQNADGRLEIFYVGTNNDLYHHWQTTPGGPSWSPETRFEQDSAKQVVAGANEDGRMEIFYIGLDDYIYHNWQTTPNGNWFGQNRFPGEQAKQLAIGRNVDGRMELFYIGLDGNLHHNWQVSPNGTWADGTAFPGLSANVLALGQNQDGRLEIFYTNANNNLYHDWQLTPSGGWQNKDGMGSPVAAPIGSGLQSGSNYLLENNCNPLTDVSVTIAITEDLTYTGNGTPTVIGPQVYGLTFQLNCYSAMQAPVLTQQYVIGFDGKQLYGQINNWANVQTAVINQVFPLSKLAGDTIPQGYRLFISLENDNLGNIIGVTFGVVDAEGNEAALLSTLLQSDGLSAQQIAPIVGFELDLVGPGSGESVTLSSGAGTIHYVASTLISVSSTGLPCAYTDIQTAETGNSVYGLLTAAPSNYFSQPFSVTSLPSQARRPGAGLRPPLLPPDYLRKQGAVAGPPSTV
jgi:hypothetical protein